LQGAGINSGRINSGKAKMFAGLAAGLQVAVERKKNNEKDDMSYQEIMKLEEVKELRKLKEE